MRWQEMVAVTSESLLNEWLTNAKEHVEPMPRPGVVIPFQDIIEFMPQGFRDQADDISLRMLANDVRVRALDELDEVWSNYTDRFLEF